MRKLLSGFYRSISASVITLTAIMMPVVIGMAGLGLDASNWMMTQRILQNAVDSAVLAAAWEYAHGLPENMLMAAEREAENNGYEPNKSGNLEITVNTDTAGEIIVTANITQKADVYLSRVVHASDIYIDTKAAATLIGPSGDFCVLALNNAASGAITFIGNTTINSPNCGLAMNSNSSSALTVQGSALAAVNDISIVGGSNIPCTSGGALQCTFMKTNSGMTADPYANLTTPNYSPCTAAQIASHTIIGTSPSGGTYYPGVYCGGLSISGNGNVTLSSGTYIMDSGSFTVAGNGSLTGSNVSIVLTTSSGDNSQIGNLDIHGGKNITLSAPQMGSEMAGVLFYQDRLAVQTSTSCDNKFNGNGTLSVDGATYFPSQCLQYNGTRDTSTAGAGCSRVIADTVIFNGDSTVANDCSGKDVENIGQYTVKLSL